MRCDVIAFIVICILCVAGVIAKDDGVPKTVPAEPTIASARIAVERYDRAMKDAENARRNAGDAAARKLIDELSNARSEAMLAQNLKEANAINDRISQAKNELSDALAPQPRRAVKLDGKWRWANSHNHSGVFLIDGDTIRVEGTAAVAKFARTGNEIRYQWPGKHSERITFTGNRFQIDTWGKDRRAFEGSPDVIGVGVLIVSP